MHRRTLRRAGPGLFAARGCLSGTFLSRPESGPVQIRPEKLVSIQSNLQEALFARLVRFSQARQQRHEQPFLILVQRRKELLLYLLDPFEAGGDRCFAPCGDGQFLGSLVPLSLGPGNQTLALQPLDDAADRRPVMMDDLGQPGGVESSNLGNRDEGDELDRGHVDLAQFLGELGGHALLRTAQQMTGHGFEAIEQHPGLVRRYGADCNSPGGVRLSWEERNAPSCMTRHFPVRPNRHDEQRIFPEASTEVYLNRISGFVAQPAIECEAVGAYRREKLTNFGGFSE